MSDPNASTKKRQITIVITSILVIVMLIFGGMVFFESKQPPRAEKPTTVRITAPGTVEDKDSWRAQASATEKNNSQQITDLRLALENQRRQQEKMQEELDKEKRGQRDAGKANPSSANAAVLNEPLPGQAGKGQILTSPVAGPGKPAFPQAAPLNTPANDAIQEVPKRELEIITFTKSKGSDASGSTGGNGGVMEVLGFPVSEEAKRYAMTKPKGPTRNHIEFLPAGSFVRVAMLNGIDAPTGGQAQSNPLPVALHVLDTANLANKYKLDIKDCRFVAAAWGDLSSERAMARTDTLTCIIEGETVEMVVKGQVIGEDGKAGIRGRLVTKQGQVLANALLAGIASGIGNAFRQSASIQSVGALGSTSTVDPDKVGQAAIGSGIGNAGNALERYYLRAADKLFPVIETDGGRTVEVLITKGAIYTGRAANIGGNYRGLVKRSGSNSRGNDDED